MLVDCVGQMVGIVCTMLVYMCWSRYVCGTVLVEHYEKFQQYFWNGDGRTVLAEWFWRNRDDGIVLVKCLCIYFCGTVLVEQ